MATTCIHKAFAIRVPADVAKQPEDQYILVEVVGDNRTYCMHSNRRARTLMIGFIGSYQAQMANAINCAGDFEGGSLVWRSYGSTGYISPAEYLSKMRRILASAKQFCDLGVTHNSVFYQFKPVNGHDDVTTAVQAAIAACAKSYAEKVRANGSDILRVIGNAYA